jgi:branched-chain amino acid transport system ATP-binding protein
VSALDVRGLCVSYDSQVALRDVDLAVPAGAMVGLLGANGAGKSTLLRAIAGLVEPLAGEIHLGGERIDGRSTHEVARLGVRLVPEGRGIFPALSVSDNLRIMLGSDDDARERALTSFPVLRDRESQVAGTLSGGEQQMLALAPAVGFDAQLLLVDEPSLGLAPRLVGAIEQTLRDLHERDGRTILLVEQYAAHVLRSADLVYVLARGRLVWAGEPGELRSSEVLARSYLGSDDA